MTEQRHDEAAAKLLRPGIGGALPAVAAWLRQGAARFAGPWSVYHHLFVFGLALIIPMALLSAELVRSYEAAERQNLKEHVGRLALQIARDYDREISSIFTTLELIAEAPALQSGDIEAVRPFVSMAARKKELGIVLTDTSRRQVFNTLVPDHSGVTPLSAMSDEDSRKIASGQALVTNVFVGALRKRTIFTVSVPVKSGPFAGYALNGGIAASELAERINLGDMPADWSVAIYDRTGRLATGSQGYGHADLSSIQKAQAAMTGRHGVAQMRNAAGEQIVIGYQRSELSDWLITVWPAANASLAVSAGSYQKLAGYTLLLALGSIALATWFGRAIAHPVSMLAERAAQLDQPRGPSQQVTAVTEVNEVMTRLDEVAARLAAGTQELRLSEARYRQLATATPAGLFRADAGGMLTFVNERWSAITGVPVEAALSCNWLDAIDPADRAGVETAWRQASTGDGKLQVECRVGGKGRGAAWVLLEINAKVSEPGDRIGVVGSLTDMTERRAAEAKRREGEDRLRLALELGHMGTFTWDFQDDVLEVDPIAATIFGLEGSAMLSYGALLSRGHADDAAAIAAFRASLHDSGQPSGLRCRILRGSAGEVRYVAVRAVCQHGTGEGPGRPRAIGVLFDVTEQTRAALGLEEINAALELRVAERTRELAAANERLKDEMHQREAAQAALSQSQKLEALGQLTSSVAHDFNNQLMAVLGGLELIEKGVREPRLLKHAQTARSAARRASQLTDQLLSFSRKGELTPGQVSIVESLAELEDVLRHAVGSRVARRVEIEPGIEAIWADPDQLHATLLNIAINARDAMPKGGELKIAARNVCVDEAHPVSGLAPGRYVSISLADTGVGMDEDVLGRAIEPFFTTKPRGRGTGLGLAMAARFAEQSGGRLAITSKPGQGTVVEILLPVAEAHELAPSGATDMGSPGFVGRGRVLCVDDDPSSAEVTGALLRSLGYDVALHVDPVRALAAAGSMQTLDLLVTDIDMPGMDGFGLAAAVRQRFPGLPVLFVTGHADHIERLRARGVAAQDPVLRKPFSTGDLTARLALMRAPARRGDERRGDLVSALAAGWRPAAERSEGEQAGPMRGKREWTELPCR